MSQEQKKSRFQISREVQEDFVNSVAENMLTLAEKAGKWQKPWTADSPVGMPFCATTGREYGGANMVKLMLTSIVNSYQDDRWLTFKQLQQYQSDHPAQDMKITKGAKGTKLLRPEEIVFIVKEDGKWEYLTDKQIKDFVAKKEQGQEVPDVQRMTLFYPFTVFNAKQIEGFPPKESQTHAMTTVDRNEFVERFIACTGIPVEHHGGDALYEPAADAVKMPFPNRFTVQEEYYATKLHEIYHATGHAKRENRKEKQTHTIKNFAFEEMRAEMFSMLAGARFDLPMPESNSAAYINKWNQTFSGGDAKAVFQAAAEAGKVLTIMHQFEMGEQPRAQWFPRSETWPELVAAQAQRDAATGTHLEEHAHISEVVAAKSTNAPQPRPAPPSFAKSAAAFQEADDPVVKARVLLQSPDLLNMALKQDSAAARSLASLCDAFAQTLSMELDEKNRAGAALPTITTAAPAARMRM